jgi:hypothetical protein
MIARRSLIGVLFATVTVALAAAVFALLPRPRGVTRAQFERLGPGMTRAEVERLLDGPPRDDVKYSGIVWVPHADGKRRSAFVGPGAPGVGFFVSEYFRDRPSNEVPPKRAPELDSVASKSGQQPHAARALWRVSVVSARPSP